MPNDDTPYPQGPSGSEGAKPADLPNPGQPGSSWPNDILIGMRRIDSEELSGFASPASLAMSLTAAENLFLNESREDTITLLNWVFQMSREHAPVEVNAPFAPPDLRSPELKRLRRLRARSKTLLYRIAVGSDFFGRRKGWAPLTDKSYLENTILAIDPIARGIEQEAEKFWKDQQDLSEARSALSKTVALYAQALELLKGSIDEESQRSNQLQDEIGSLNVRLASLEVHIQAAEADFKRAVESQGAGCSFGQFITFVASVVAVAVGVYTAIAGIAASIADYAEASELADAAAARGQDAVPTDQELAQAYAKTPSEARLPKWEHDKNIINVFKAVGPNLKQIGGAISEVEKMVQDRNDNRAKIVMQQQDYRKILEPFMNLPEARKLQDLLDAFLETAQTRNERVLDYTQSRLRLRDLRLDMELKLDRSRQMQEYLAAHANPDLEEVSSFLDESLQSVKLQLVWLLHMARASLAFWSLKDEPLFFNDKTVAGLLKTYADWKLAEVVAIESSGRPEAPYGGKSGIKLVLSPTSYPKLFEQFKKDGTVTLKFTPESSAFAIGFSSMRIRKFSVHLLGAKPAQPVSPCIANVELEHLGNSVFQTPDRKLAHFHHSRRKAVYAYDIAASGNDAAPITDGTFNGVTVVKDRASTVYADVSQLGLFGLRINEDSYKNVDLSSLESVELRFWGTFLPFHS